MLIDSYVDGAAYMAIAGELIDGEPVPPNRDMGEGLVVVSPAVTLVEPDAA